jgi:hypothetical protein
VAEELAEGFFRAIFALFRGLVGFILEVLRDVLGELILRGLAQLLIAFAQAIGFLIRFASWVVEGLLFLVFKRPIGKQTAFVYAMAMLVLMVGGFFIGATASTFYHQLRGYEVSAALPER